MKVGALLLWLGVARAFLHTGLRPERAQWRARAFPWEKSIEEPSRGEVKTRKPAEVPARARARPGSAFERRLQRQRVKAATPTRSTTPLSA